MPYWLPIVILFYMFGADLQLYYGREAYDTKGACQTEVEEMLSWHLDNKKTPGPMFYESHCIRINFGRGISYGGAGPDLTYNRP